MKKKPRRGNLRSLSNAGPLPNRTEALLAQILMQSMGDAGHQKKALALRAAGFSNVEIGQFMGTTADVVAQVLYMARRGRAGGAKPKHPKRSKR